MAWLQVIVTTDENKTHFVEGILEDLGALSITLQDAEDNPVLEPDPGTTPVWLKTRVIALFSADTTRQAILDLLEQQGIGAVCIQAEVLEDRDWEKEWMSHFQPMQFGSRLNICPSWKTPANEPGSVTMQLDPGLAFGTGTHPTTALCLLWLAHQQITDKSIIDYGCGSGILAIAALLLGAREASAVDIDPQALEASASNARNNSVAERLQLFTPNQLPQNLKADIVIANILSQPLIRLAEQLAALTVAEGQIALSGILKEQEDEVRKAYQNFYNLSRSDYKDEWVLITGIRRAD